MSAETKDWYAEYLATDGWRLRREQAIWRAQRRCQSPFCRLVYLRSLTDAELREEEDERLPPHAYRLEVHHLTYDRIGHEHPDDLIVLCPRCHATVHGLVHIDEPFPSPTDKTFTKSIGTALASALEQMIRDA